MDRPERTDPRAAIAIAFCLLALIGLVTPADAQRGPDPHWVGGARGWFDAEARGAFDENGAPIAEIQLGVPYRNLIFLRRGDRFIANYRVRIVQRESGRAVAAREWRGTVEVENYKATRGTAVLQRKLEFAFSETAVGDPDALIELEVVVRLLDSDRQGSRELSLQRPRVPAGGIALGDLALYRARHPELVPSLELDLLQLEGAVDGELFRPAEQGVFDLATGPPWLHVRVFDLRSERVGETHFVELSILSGTEGDAVAWRDTVELVSGARHVSALLRLPPSSMHHGTNRVRISLATGGERGIQFENMGLDISDDDSWKANLKVLEFLAEKDEWRELQDAAPQERAARWRAFWARRDPDPEEPGNARLEVHFERVAYARQQYRDGFLDGALSDRGRVYVQLGAPDSIEEQNLGRGNYEAYQLWHYYDLQLVFYFREEGLGHYRLVWRERR